MVTEEWAADAWPWLTHQSGLADITPPAGPAALAVPGLLLALAERSVRLDSTSSALVLAYAISALDDVDLERHAIPLRDCAGRVDGSSSVMAADQLALAAMRHASRIAAVGPLSDAFTAALQRCPLTEEVTRAQNVFGHAPRPETARPALALRVPFQPPGPAAAITQSETPVEDSPGTAGTAMNSAAGTTTEPTQTIGTTGAVEIQTVAGLPARGGTGDPWEVFTSQHPEGSQVRGRVTSTTEYGVFVNLSPDVTGMIHISELADRRVRQVTDVVRVGQPVNVRILSAIPRQGDRRARIALSMIGVDQRDSTAAGQRAGETGQPGRAAHRWYPGALSRRGLPPAAGPERRAASDVARDGQSEGQLGRARSPRAQCRPHL